MILRPLNAIRQKRKGYTKLGDDTVPLLPKRTPSPPRRQRRQRGSGDIRKKKSPNYDDDEEEAELNVIVNNGLNYNLYISVYVF